MPSFSQQLKKRSPLPDKQEMALLVVDVSKECCDPAGLRGNAETAEISARIQSLVPAFRKAGVPVYVIYTPDDKNPSSDPGFYQFIPDSGDVLIAKNRNSAIAGSDLKNILRKDGRKLLLACGFNLNACLRETVIDACDAGFDVCLLTDLAGNDNTHQAPSTAEYFLGTMRKKGIAMEKAPGVLRQLNKG